RRGGRRSRAGREAGDRPGHACRRRPLVVIERAFGYRRTRVTRLSGVTARRRRRGPFRPVRRDASSASGSPDGAWLDVRRQWLVGADALFERLLPAVPWHAERRQMYDRIVDV